MKWWLESDEEDVEVRKDEAGSEAAMGLPAAVRLGFGGA